MRKERPREGKELVPGHTATPCCVLASIPGLSKWKRFGVFRVNGRVRSLARWSLSLASEDS
jgi:hypothetical protein